MIIQDCPNCGGIHYGSLKCSYIKTPCVICGEETIFACSDCAIESGGNSAVHVCAKTECRDRHEAAVHGQAAKDGT